MACNRTTRASWILGILVVCPGLSVIAQEPFLFRKDIVVSQQSGPGATAGPTTVGDFNGDGRPDIVLCNAAGSAILLNSEGANFGPPTRISDECATVPGDFNGDGRLDIVAVNHLLIGRGNGTFLLPSKIGPDGTSPRVVTSGDFNGDGRTDLVFYTGLLSLEDGLPPVTIHVFLATGNGAFRESWKIANPAALLLGVAIAADFNRDNRPDLAVNDGNGILVFLGLGDGTFRDRIKTVTGEDTALLVAGDFNRDGFPDVASTFSVALGTGDGRFRTPIRHPAPATRNEFEPTPALMVSAVADLNGDGHLDLAGSLFGLPPFLANQVRVLPGKGDGTLLPPVGYSVGLFPQGAVAADIDGDARTDLVATGSVSNTVSLLLSRAASGKPLRRAVSAASGTALVAPGSLATLIAPDLAAATEQAQPPWPSRLGGVSLEIRDAAGAVRLAPLLYVSPTQMNFQVPSETALGEATLTIVSERGSSAAGTMQVDAVAPGVFVVSATLSPFPRPAAIAVRIEPDGSQTIHPLLRCDGAGFCSPEFPVADGRPLYVSFFATGFRNASPSRVSCTSDGQLLVITYAGSQGTPGVDQINVRVPEIGGRPGLGTVVCAIDGVVANPVWL